VADSARGGASAGGGSNGGVSESGGRRGLRPVEWWPTGVVVFITASSTAGTGGHPNEYRVLARAWLSWKADLGFQSWLSQYGWPSLAMPQALFTQPNTQFLTQLSYGHMWNATKHTLQEQVEDDTCLGG